MQKIRLKFGFFSNIVNILEYIVFYFKLFCVKEPRLEAEIIISHVLKISRLELHINKNYKISNFEIKKIEILFNRKVNREPISYILGFKEFWSLVFEVNNSVLIPRPETENLVDSVIPFLMDSDIPMKVLDAGTGSGAVVVALANEEMYMHKFYALDLSKNAIKIAKINAFKNNLNNIIFFKSCWTDSLKVGQIYFDLIVVNPPYIRIGDLIYLEPEISMYEPSLSLDGGQDGLKCYRELIKRSFSYLSSGGLLALEIGCDQAVNITNMLKKYYSISNVKVIKDYSGVDRILHVFKN